ncbi:VWA domain-containing protein [Dactylosporangium sp. CA-092794]|uniref:VWA domain-containing protein n=1 Tax=Dactylosporangium sp. CA-092794 TaxID=3239929 RepID=UPI003D91BDE4
MTTATNPPASSGKHLNPDPDAPAPAAPADAGWLRLSAALTAQIAPVAGRADLIVVCEPGAGHGAPACLIREQACVEIDGTYLDCDLNGIDPDDPDAREQFPVLWGLLVHEAAHGQHTCWDFGTGEPAAAEAATVLEESRIEAAQVRRRPGDRRWLRAASTKILLADVPTTDDLWSAAGTAALVLARADAGVLDPDEVEPVRDAVVKILGPARLDRLTEIWRQAHATDDFDTDAMVELGRRWCAVLGIKPDDTSIPPLGGPAGGGSGTPGGGPGDGQGGSPAGGGTLRRAAGQVVVIVADHDGEDAKAKAEAAQRAAQQAAARDAESKAQTRANAAGAKVFSNPGGVGPGSGRSSGVRRNPPTPSTRPATEAERAAARQLARALRAAAHREPTETIVAAPTPPGRLRARAAMNADAQRAMGQQPTAEPWRRTERRRHPNPPIQVGICADVSPSVSAFAGPIASAAWITAQATAWAGGTSATITFGQYVTPVTQPGQPPAQVRLFDEEGDTAGFPLAVDALDGALDLANPRAGARLLVVVSDGEFTGEEKLAGQQRLDRLLRAGCALLWLAPPGSTPLTGGQQVTLTDPARSGQLIARAATAALAAHA